MRVVRGDVPSQQMGSEGQVDGEQEENGASGGVDSTEGQGREPTISDLISLLRSHMGQQEAREAKQKEESAKQEQRFKALQHQFQLLQVEVQARTSPVPEGQAAESPDPESLDDDILPQAGPSISVTGSSGQSHFLEPKLQKLTNEDDIEHFLITFERIAMACRWQRHDWVFHLVPLLTGKARGAYVHMDVDDFLDYDKVKAAILYKYDINPETYRQRFRSLDVNPAESSKELYARLKELYVKWVHPEDKTVQDIGEIIILEQYLRMLSPELQVWIKEHNPPSAAEAAKLADVFVAARKKGQPWSFMAWKTKDSRKSLPQRPAANVSRASYSHSPNGSLKSPAKTLVCYLCGMEGHTKPMCPENSAKLTQMCFVPRNHDNSEIKLDRGLKMTSVEINGDTLKALIDTGSTQTLVHRQFVPLNSINMTETIPVCCVHGDEKPYPTADLYIKVQDGTREVAQVPHGEEAREISSYYCKSISRL